MNCKHCDDLVIISEEAALWIQHVFNFSGHRKPLLNWNLESDFFFFFYRLVTSQKHFLTMKEASNDLRP